MRAFVVVSCLFAVASAGLLHPTTYGAKAPIFDQNGYKIDEVNAINPLVAGPLAAPWLGARSIAPWASPLLAAPLAAPVAYAGDYKWVGPQHLPVIGPNGVPLDTPEVAAGKVANAVAHVEAKARNGDLHHLVAAPIAPVVTANLAAPLAYSSYATHAYPQHIPVIGPNGVPLDTPAVAHAKAVHFEAHVDAKLRNGHLPLVHHLKRRSVLAAPLSYAHAYPQHIPVIGPNGVPLETPEVVAAKIGHAAAHVEARTRNLAVVAPYAATPLAAPWLAGQAIATPLAAPIAYAGEHHWVGPQHLPVIGPNGVPLDTPEVAAGKVANAVAHVEAKARNGDLHHVVAAPLAPLAHIAAPLAYAHAYPQHIPVIGPNGVPLDTPEVAAGKVANAVAHAEAHARNGDYYHY